MNQTNKLYQVFAWFYQLIIKIARTSLILSQSPRLAKSAQFYFLISHIYKKKCVKKCEKNFRYFKTLKFKIFKYFFVNLILNSHKYFKLKFKNSK